jgi:cell division transport system permease protein
LRQLTARSRRTKIGGKLREQLKNWGLLHLQCFFFSLGQLCRTPAATLVTIAVIGIALALPAGFYQLLDNLLPLNKHWDDAVQISLFLKPKFDERAANKLAGLLRIRKDIAHVKLITKAQALEEYRRLAGFGSALALLNDNPLPNVVVVRPTEAAATPTASQVLLTQLEKLPEVELAQLDIQWVKRLNALMDLGRQAVGVLAGLLALAVLLVVGNTIRLGIHNHHDAIVIASLFGATRAFIRRPFLHSGCLYGLGGAIMAWILVKIAFALLSLPVRTLAALYSSDFELHGLSLGIVFILLLCGPGLGLIGSWLAVEYYLRKTKLGPA